MIWSVRQHEAVLINFLPTRKQRKEARTVAFVTFKSLPLMTYFCRQLPYLKSAVFKIALPAQSNAVKIERREDISVIQAVTGTSKTREPLELTLRGKALQGRQFRHKAACKEDRFSIWVTTSVTELRKRCHQHDDLISWKRWDLLTAKDIILLHRKQSTIAPWTTKIICHLLSFETHPLIMPSLCRVELLL